MAVIWSNPVNKGHPLNRGLANWWLNTPTNHGGTTFRDIQGTNHGTLTNMDPTTDWVRGNRRGSWGALDFSGTTDYVDCGIVKAWAGASKATLSGWMFRSALGTTCGFGQYPHPYKFLVLWYTDNKIYVTASNGSDNWPSFLFSETGWHHVVHVFDGSLSGWDRVSLYVDGLEVSLNPGGASPPATLASSANQDGTAIGRDPRDWDGQVDDVRTYGRALNASEVHQLYNLSRTGYGGLLNRRRRVFAVPAAAPGGNAMPMAMHHYRQRRAG